MTHVTVQQLSASLDGALTGPSLELVVRHLAACHECRDRQVRLAKHDDALRRLLGQEPPDLFLDDLTRRAEHLVTAITRSLPVPVITTSVPLLHEEDPYEPAEPPPLPERPEPGQGGDIAKQAGWGRIGLKPTASTQAPQSDPAEAQRMLDALAGGATDAFPQPTTPRGADPGRSDAPAFELPAWVNDRPKQPGPNVRGGREVPRLSVFLGNRDEHTLGPPREPGHEAFRRDEAFEPPPFDEGSLARDMDAYELHEIEPVPPEHAPFAPPGWSNESSPPEPRDFPPPAWNRERASLEPRDFPPPERNREPAPPEPLPFTSPPWSREPAPSEPMAFTPPTWNPEPELSASAGSGPDAWTIDPPQFAPRDERAWQTGAPESGSLTPSPYLKPMTRSVDDYLRVEHEIPAYQPASPGLERAVVLALVTVGGLLLILLALQMIPAPTPSSGNGATGFRGLHLPLMRSPRHDDRRSLPEHAQARTHAPVVRPPLDQVLPPLAQPDADVTSDSAATQLPGHLDETATPPGDAAPAPASTAAGAAVDAPKSVTRAWTRALHGPATTALPTAGKAAAAAADWPLLCGEVDDDTGQPVPGARVSIAEISLATRTDATGHFCMAAPPGAHNLFVEASGFTPQSVAVQLSGLSPSLNLMLQPAP